MTVIVTDAKYRAAVAAVRSLARAGHTVVLTQAALDSDKIIPAFNSVYANETVLFDCSADDEIYKEKLIELCKKYDTPILFPIGAKTLSLIAENKDEFSLVSKFTLPHTDALDLANDKEKVRLAAEKCGIAVPKTYTNGEIPSEFPVIIKPRCGEKFGLSAKERYVIVKNPKAYKTAYEKMAKYGGDPIVQQLVMGQGVGISLLMSNGKALSAICHKRIREYPQSGGPSACCESFYDEKLVRASEKLLASMHFNGFAMVEYKCSKDENYLLEINPRIWGSFPLTEKSGATFADDYVKLSSGEDIIHPLDNYKCKVRMNFVLSDLAACLDLMRHGRLISAAGGLFDIITLRAKDALRDKNDPEVLKSYYKLKLKRGDDK